MPCHLISRFHFPLLVDTDLQGYLAPSKIDPRLLDPHYVFNTTETNPEASSSSSAAAAKGANVFQQPDKATRQRSGSIDSHFEMQ